MSFNTDLYVHWPVSMDYPYWRWQLDQFAHHFNKIYIHFNHGGGEDISDFIQDALSHLKPEFIPVHELQSGDDWANVAVHDFLDRTTAERFLIMHQDVIMAIPDKFISSLLSHEEIPLLGIASGEGNIQPSCFLAHRHVLEEKTNMNFSPIHGRLDHFESLSVQLRANKGQVKTLDELNIHGYEHISGVTQNWTHGLDPAYEIVDPVGFNQYLTLCREALYLEPIIELDVKSIARIQELQERCLSYL